MSKNQQGFSLIELIIFIVIIGFVSTTLLIGINHAQRYSGIHRALVKANYLADSRMQIILMNRDLNGFATLNDPCTATPALNVCTPLATYATANGFSVSATFTGSNPRAITINITGASNATLRTRAYNYANN